MNPTPNAIITKKGITNSKTNQTTYDLPTDKPISKQEHTYKSVQADDKPDEKAETSTPGWVKIYTPEGRPYYQNSNTKQTQWNPPNDTKQIPIAEIPSLNTKQTTKTESKNNFSMGNIMNTTMFEKVQIVCMILLLIFNIICWSKSFEAISRYLATSECSDGDILYKLVPFGIGMIIITIIGIILCIADFYLFVKYIFFGGELKKYIIPRVRMECAMIFLYYCPMALVCIISAAYADYIIQPVRATINWTCTLSILYGVFLIVEMQDDMLDDGRIVNAINTIKEYHTSKISSYYGVGAITVASMLLFFQMMPNDDLELCDNMGMTIGGIVQEDFSGLAFEHIYYNKDITIDFDCYDRFNGQQVVCDASWEILDKLYIGSGSAYFDYDHYSCGDDIYINLNECGTVTCNFDDTNSTSYEICYSYCLWKDTDT
eukprot:313236_1